MTLKSLFQWIVILALVRTEAQSLEAQCIINGTATQKYANIDDDVLVEFDYIHADGYQLALSVLACDSKGVVSNCERYDKECGLCLEMSCDEYILHQALITLKEIGTWTIHNTYINGELDPTNVMCDASMTFEVFEPSILKFENFDGNVIEDTDINITCSELSGVPPARSIKLYIDENHQKNCSMDNHDSQCSMTVNVNRSFDGKSVICTAYQVHYKNPSLESEILNIQYAPVKATANQTAFEAVKGSRILLSCHVEDSDKGNPPSYNFTFHQLHTENSWNSQNGGIEIEDANECEDSGEYECCPSNIAGDGGCDDFKVVISVPATVEKFPNSVSVYVDDPLDLNCTCEGIPCPAISFTYSVSDLFAPKDTSNRSDECSVCSNTTSLLWYDDITKKKKVPTATLR